MPREKACFQRRKSEKSGSDPFAWPFPWHYTVNGERVAVRVGAVLSYLYHDQVGSRILASDALTNVVGSRGYYAFGATRRRSDPVRGVGRHPSRNSIARGSRQWTNLYRVFANSASAW